MKKIFLIFAVLIPFTLFSCDNDNKEDSSIDGPEIFDYNPLRIVFLDAHGNNLLGSINTVGNADVVPFPVEYDAKIWINHAEYPIVMPDEYPPYNLYFSVAEKALYYDFPDVADMGYFGNHRTRTELRCPAYGPIMNITPLFWRIRLQRDSPVMIGVRLPLMERISPISL